MDLSAYKVDPKACEEGTWIDLDASSSLLIRRYNNTAFKKRWQALLAPHKRQLQRGTLDPAKSDEVLTRAIADEILVDWKGIKKDGKPLPYSKKNAYDILIDPVFVEFREEVVSMAQDVENFRAEDLAEAKGNS